MIERQLAVMDLGAAAMLTGKKKTIRVFSMDDPEAFRKVLSGEDVGTTVVDE